MGKGKIRGREIFWKPAKDFQEERKKFSETTVSLTIKLTEVIRKLNVVWLHWFLDRLRRVFNLSVVGGGWLGSIGGGMAGSLVGDISDESVDMVSSVGGGLDSAIGKSNHEATGNKTVGILCFCLLEVGLAVVISHAV